MKYPRDAEGVSENAVLPEKAVLPIVSTTNGGNQSGFGGVLMREL